jgi:hypothetical protein
VEVSMSVSIHLSFFHVRIEITCFHLHLFAQVPRACVK